MTSTRSDCLRELGSLSALGGSSTIARYHPSTVVGTRVEELTWGPHLSYPTGAVALPAVGDPHGTSSLASKRPRDETGDELPCFEEPPPAA